MSDPVEEDDPVAAEEPLDEFTGITVEWPDEIELPAIEPLPPLAQGEDGRPLPPDDTGDAAFAGIERLPERVNEETLLVEIDQRLTLGFPADDALFPEREEFVDRFESLSTIEELRGEEQDNLAQLAARGRADEELLTRLLRIYGYYDAQVIRSFAGMRRGGGGNPDAEDDAPRTGPRVQLDIVPGPRYRFGAIDLGALDTAPDYAALRAAYQIQSGDPLSSDKIVEEQFDLDTALGESGYPFAEIDEPELLVDHAREEGDLTMPVRPNGKYVFGEVTSNLPAFMSGRHLADIARFDPGDVYKRSLELDLRRAVIATGIVSSAVVTPREVSPPSGDQPGVVAMDVEMREADLRTIAGAIGYGSEEGIRVEASWEHRNLFPPEGALRVRGIAGTQEQLAGVTFKKNNFGGRDRILNLDLYASNVTRASFDARTAAFIGSYERASTLLFQKPLSWAFGLELVATDERNRGARDGDVSPRQTYFVASVFGRATIDTSDSLLDPTRGFRLTGFLAPEVSRTQGTQAFYLRNQADASYYQTVSDGIVLAARTRLATIQGADLFQIAPSRRLYAGGGGSVRGYAYRGIGPKNALGEATGGRSLVEFSLEARIDTPLMGGAVAVVPFFDAGAVSTATTPDFGFVKYGAGVGVRYKTGFGPIRLDVGVPLNPDEFDSPVAVYVSIGQAF